MSEQRKIVLYCEKQDVAIRFASALGGIDVGGKIYDINNYDSNLKAIKAATKRDGFIETAYKGVTYYIIWGWGHWGTLKDVSDYNQDYKNWWNMPIPFIPPRYETKRRKSGTKHFDERDDKELKVIKKFFGMKDIEACINFCDYEREGELIFCYLLDIAPLSYPYFRGKLNEQTQSGIRKALDTLVPGEANKPRELAARARSAADFALGINLTVADTLCQNERGTVFHIGRVITPALAMIVERELAIRNFKESVTWGIRGSFTAKDGKVYTGKWTGDSFEKKEDADALIKGLPSLGVIKSIEKKNETSYPPRPFSTTTLQSEANRELGFTLDETLQIAQSLYEKGYITYPRVDSEYLTEDKRGTVMEERIRLLIENGYGGKTPLSKIDVPKRYFSNAKVDAHDAIITTDLIPESLTEVQEDLYTLIAKRVVALAYPPLITEKTEVITAVGAYEFKSTGSIIVQEGYYAVTPRKMPTSDIPDCLNVDDEVIAAFDAAEQKTVPPRRFTDGTFVKAMEAAGRQIEEKELRDLLNRAKGLGRPSTRAGIVERLISYKYIKRKGKELAPTDTGIKVIETLPVPELKSPHITAEWEQDLDNIENLIGNNKEAAHKAKTFINDIHSKVTEWVSAMPIKHAGPFTPEASGLVCPLCGKPMDKYRYEYRCASDTCDFKISHTIAGVTLPESSVGELLAGDKIGPIEGFTSKKSKDGFSASLFWDAEKGVQFSFGVETAITCPVCSKPIAKEQYRYNCGCGFFIPRFIGGRELTEDDISALVTGNTIGPFGGLKSKSGKEFAASFKIGNEGKLEYEFAGEDASKKFEGIDYKCPRCSEPLSIKRYFMDCECGFKMPLVIGGHEFSEDDINSVLQGRKIGPFKNLKSKSGKTYSASFKFDGHWELKYEFEGGAAGEESDAECPECGKKLLSGKWNYTCGCGVKLPKEICGKKITKVQLEKLIKTGKTDLIKGFKSKAGNKFDARLVRDGQGVSFEFESSNKK